MKITFSVEFECDNNMCEVINVIENIIQKTKLELTSLNIAENYPVINIKRD